jgi:HK97 family phage portal protein
VESDLVKSLIGGLAGAVRNATPVSYAPRRGGLPLAGLAGSSTEQQLRAYGGVGTLYSIVHLTSNATSQVDWRLYRKSVDNRRTTATGEVAKRTEVTRHAALDLWNTPNPFQTGQEFREAAQQHLDLVGESTILVVRSDLADLPLELWPVRPDRLVPVPHPTDFLAGWIYCGPDGEKVPLGTDEVIQLKMPNPLDPYRGLGPVQAILTDLDSARYSAEWNRNFFANSAEPGGVIEVDKRLTDEEFDEMTERWREQHQGVNNAHRVAVIEQGKWVSNAMSMRDMQFKELRDVSREIIREAFGIHAHLLGITEDVNRANADAAEVSFARWLITPRCERWKQMLNARLLPLFGATGQGVEFDHDRVVPEDREADDRERTSKAQAAQLLVAAGYDPADVARAVGLPEMAFVGPTGAPVPAA